MKDKKKLAQTMVEFALVLPVLLALLFFIVEAGRLFQVWLSIQNSARVSVRYAVTGDFDLKYCPSAAQILTDSPLNTAAIDYAAADTYGGDPADCSVPQAYTDDHPGQDFANLTSKLEDQARLPSIVDVAIAGAVAIPWDSSATSTDKGYLQITICSTRDWNGDGNPGNDFFFYPGGGENYARCELQTAPGGPVDYQDAGGPGDRIIISVEFNHPMITPFISADWQFVHLMARQEGIVENFRFKKALAAPPQINIPGENPTDETATSSASETVESSETPEDTETPNPSETITPTENPPGCKDPGGNDVLNGDDSEQLGFRYNDTGYILESHLTNNGYTQVQITGAELHYNGAWHEALDAGPNGRRLDSYQWGNATIATSIQAFSSLMDDNFATPKVLAKSASNWFRWIFTDTSFYYIPYLQAYPEGSPTSSLARNQNPEPYDNHPTEGHRQLFYHSSDFTAVIYYDVIDSHGNPTASCTLSVTGQPGPTIQPQVSPGKSLIGGSDELSIRALVNGDDSNTDYVIFYVYDSLGTLVYWNREDSAPFCLFGLSGGNCQTRTVWSDSWGTNGEDTINGGSYTVAILAHSYVIDSQSQARPKSTLIKFQLEIASPSSLIILITVPDANGGTINSINQTGFRAVAWDTNFGQNAPDGSGISKVEFQMVDPGGTSFTPIQNRSQVTALLEAIQNLQPILADIWSKPPSIQPSPSSRIYPMVFTPFAPVPRGTAA